MREPSKKALRAQLAKATAVLAKEFPKIRTMSDVKRMAKRNWARYCRWDWCQKEIAFLHMQIAASKPPKRIGSKERVKQVGALGLAGADMQTIVEKTQLSESTIRYYLWLAIADELLSEETGDYAEKEFELKRRLYPGIKWRKGGNYRMGSITGSRHDQRLHSDLMRPVRYAFNDGTVRYMIGTQEAQGPFKQ